MSKYKVKPLFETSEQKEHRYNSNSWSISLIAVSLELWIGPPFRSKNSGVPWKKIQKYHGDTKHRGRMSSARPNGRESMLTIVSWYWQRNGWVSGLTMGDSARIGAPQYNGLPPCSRPSSKSLHWWDCWVVSSQYKRAYKTYNSPTWGSSNWRTAVST